MQPTSLKKSNQENKLEIILNSVLLYHLLDGFTIATDRDLAANFKRCFFYKRLSVIRKERVSAFDIDECKVIQDFNLENQEIYFLYNEIRYVTYRYF